MDNLIIKSGGGDYTVEFVDTVAETLDKVRGISNARRIIDSNLLFRCQAVVGDNFGFRAEERYKTFARVHQVLDWLQESGTNKQTTLVAIGGGIVQDIATMAAHLYYRGIKLVLVPTTLLSQADSCIGAKCGINLGGKKNQLGCFHSPSRVIVCWEFLDTLDETAIKSGWGEILKLYLISGMTFDETIYDEPLPRNIHRSLVNKQLVIEADEYETATDKIGRRVLNYGHTFGHALEAVTNNAMPHGIAVAWGIDVANYFNAGTLPNSLRERIKVFIRTHLSWKLPPLKATDLVDAVRRDKKARADAVKLVLMDAPGEFRLHLCSWPTLERGLVEYLTTENVYI